MKTRTWPYGTRKEVVIEVIRRGVIFCFDAEEAYVLIGHGLPISQLPNVGDRRTIVFTQGGPTGGHWRLEQ